MTTGEAPKPARVELPDVFRAISLLTRLPVPTDGERMALAAWAWPLAGFVVAILSAAVGQMAIWVGLPAPVAAGLILGTAIMATGALHEDGLADCADGFWGSTDRGRRLEIMKDSRVGTYGVLALLLGVGLRWCLLSAVIGSGALWSAVIAAALISRAAMAVVMHRLPFARDGGLAAYVGRPAGETVLLAGAVAGIGAVLFAGTAALAAGVVGAATSAIVAIVSLRKIGGQTGDTLGAVQQLTEITALATFVVLAT